MTDFFLKQPLPRVLETLIQVAYAFGDEGVD